MRAVARAMTAPVKAEMSVMLNVKDVERSVRFYKSLGFDVRWEMKGDDDRLNYAGVGMGDAVIALGKIPKDLRGMSKDYAEWVSSPLGAGVMVTVELDPVEEVHAKAKKAKAPIDSPLSERLYGTAFMVNDPDGYVVRFLRPKGVYA
jgi:catechol 2,3-dioxygenase-like lactoylglutathione lyase family enzyme